MLVPVGVIEIVVLGVCDGEVPTVADGVTVPLLELVGVCVGLTVPEPVLDGVPEDVPERVDVTEDV